MSSSNPFVVGDGVFDFGSPEDPATSTENESRSDSQNGRIFDFHPFPGEVGLSWSLHHDDEGGSPGEGGAASLISCPHTQWRNCAVEAEEQEEKKLSSEQLTLSFKAGPPTRVCAKCDWQNAA